LDDVVVLLRPVNTAPQLPDVDQIADDVKRFTFVLAQKSQKRAGIGAARVQMNVGNPGGAHFSYTREVRTRDFK